MKYTVTLSDKYRSKYWNSPDCGELVDSTETIERSTHSIEIAKNILREFLDPCDYKLSDANIKKEFGEHISERALTQIKNYYHIRGVIYGDSINDLERTTREWGSSSNPKIFKYEVPSEYNHFTLVEKDDLNDSWDQKEFIITLKITEN